MNNDKLIASDEVINVIEVGIGEADNIISAEVLDICRMFVDYAPCEECTNPYTWGHICVKCGECGRKFDERGVLQEQEAKNDKP